VYVASNANVFGLTCSHALDPAESSPVYHPYTVSSEIENLERQLSRNYFSGDELTQARNRLKLLREHDLMIGRKTHDIFGNIPVEIQ
jgi:hypothetical protein